MRGAFEFRKISVYSIAQCARSEPLAQHARQGSNRETYGLASAKQFVVTAMIAKQNFLAVLWQ